MSLFRRKGPYDLDPGELSRSPRRSRGKKPLSPEEIKRARRRVFLLLVSTVLSLIGYFGCVALGFEAILFVYAGVAGVLILCYVIFNQGFVYRDATPQMLPDTLDDEQKRSILAGARKRAERSRWLLVIFVALIIPILLDALYLFFLQDLLAFLNGKI